MRNILPIPSELLTDSVTLYIPERSGYTTLDVYNVRVEHKLCVTEHTARDARDISEIVVYYDCVNSSPSEVSFAAGMLMRHLNTRYEILTVEHFAALQPHHIRITARKV